MTIRNKLHEAIIFATERHAGQKRKGTDIYYSDGLDALEDLQYHDNTRNAYREAMELFKVIIDWR